MKYTLEFIPEKEETPWAIYWSAAVKPQFFAELPRALEYLERIASEDQIAFEAALKREQEAA